MDPEKHNTLIRFLRIALSESGGKDVDSFEDVRDGVDLVHILDYCLSRDELWLSIVSEKDLPFEKIESLLVKKYGKEHLEIRFDRLLASHRDTLELAKVVMLIMILCMNEGQYVEAMKECDFATQTNIFEMHKAVDAGGGVLGPDWFAVLMISDRDLSPDVSTCSPFKLPRGRRSRSLLNVSEKSLGGRSGRSSVNLLKHPSDTSTTTSFTETMDVDDSNSKPATSIGFTLPARPPRQSLVAEGDGQPGCSSGVSAARAGSRLRIRARSLSNRRQTSKWQSEGDILEDNEMASLVDDGDVPFTDAHSDSDCPKSVIKQDLQNARLSLAGARSLQESLHRGNITFRSPTSEDEFVYTPGAGSTGRRSRSKLTISPLSASFAFGRKSMMGAEDLRNLRRAISNRSVIGEHRHDESPIEQYQNSPVAKYKSRLNAQLKYSQQLEVMLAEANDKVKIEETKTESLARKVDELSATVTINEKLINTMKQENERLTNYRSPTRDKMELELQRFKSEANKLVEVQDLKNMYINENQSLQKQIENLELELKRSRAAVEATEKKINAITNRCETSAEEHEAEVLRLKRQLESYQTSERALIDLSDHVASLESKNAKLESEKMKVFAEIEAVRNEYSEMKRHNSDMIKTHSERFKRHEEEEEQWMQDLQTQRLMYDELLTRNKATEAELASKLSCYEVLSQQNHSLQEENVALQDAKAKFQSEINAKSEAFEWDTKILNDRMAEERASNKHHVTLLESKVTELQENLRLNQEAFAAKERLLQADLAKSEKLQAALIADQKEFEQKMDAESAELQNQLSTVSERASDYEFKWLALKDEVEELETKADTAEREHRITVERLISDWKLKVEKAHTKNESDAVQHQNEVKVLRSQISEMEKQYSAFRSEKEAQIEDFNLSVRELTTQRESLLENMTTVKEENEAKILELSEQIESGKVLLVASKQEAGQLKSEVTKRGCERDQLAKDLAEAKASLFATSTILSKTQTDMEAMEQRYLSEKSSLECSLKSMRDLMSDKENQFDREMQQIKDGHVKQLSEMKNNCQVDLQNLGEELKKVTKKLQEKLSKKQQEVSLLEQEKKDLSVACSKLNQQLALAESRIVQIDADLEENKSKLENAILNNKSMAEELSQLKMKLASEESSNSHLSDQLLKRGAEIEEHELNLKKLREELENNERSHGEVRTDLFAQLQVHIQNKNKFLDEIKELKAKLSRSKDENSRLREEQRNTLVAKHVSEKRASEFDAELTSLSHQLQTERETANAERLDQEKALSEQRDIVEQQKELMEKQSEDNNSLKMKLKHAISKAEKAKGLREQLAQKDKAISELNFDLDLMKQKVQDLNAQTVEYKSELTRSQTLASELQAECESVKQESLTRQRFGSLGPNLRMRQHSGESTSTRTSIQSAPLHLPRMNLFETDCEPDMNYSTSVTASSANHTRPQDDVCFKQPEVPPTNRHSAALGLGGDLSFSGAFNPSASLPCLSEASDMSLTFQNGFGDSTPMRKQPHHSSDLGGTPDASRLLELNRRNTMVGPALRDTYVAETSQFEDLQEGSIKGKGKMHIPESVIKRDERRSQQELLSSRKRIAASARFSPANAMGKLKKRFSKENHQPLDFSHLASSQHKRPVPPSISFDVPLTPAKQDPTRGSAKDVRGTLADGSTKKKSFLKNPLRSQN